MKQLSLARWVHWPWQFPPSGCLCRRHQSVAVTAIVEHPALDAVRDGVRTP
jgi:ABC-type uncharacterized transport system substrate-binding protein